MKEIETIEELIQLGYKRAGDALRASKRWRFDRNGGIISLVDLIDTCINRDFDVPDVYFGVGESYLRDNGTQYTKLIGRGDTDFAMPGDELWSKQGYKSPWER